MTSPWRSLLLSLGPGLIWAGAAIGVSHLVQSTRAGASYGFALVWAVLLANLCKYPFFEFANRYTAATGESLLDGYKRLGKWPLPLFLVLTLGTMFTVQAAVTIVTASILSSVLGASISPILLSAALLLLCGGMLFVGRFPLLDRLMKGIILLLSLSTLVAVLVALGHGSNAQPEYLTSFTWSATDIAFLIALMGWMPTPIDCSVWTSLWCLERHQETGHRPCLRDTQIDIAIGYVVTTLLALGFMALGALVMYGTGTAFEASGAGFSAQLIALYTSTLGETVRPIIQIAAVTAMLSTTLTVLDGYSRVFAKMAELLSGKAPTPAEHTRLLRIGIVVTAVGGMAILVFFLTRMTGLVDLATTLSFLPAPILAYLNYRAVTANDLPEEFRPGKGMLIWSWLGMGFLTSFALLYIGSMGW